MPVVKFPTYIRSNDDESLDDLIIKVISPSHKVRLIREYVDSQDEGDSNREIINLDPQHLNGLIHALTDILREYNTSKQAEEDRRIAEQIEDEIELGYRDKNGNEISEYQAHHYP